MTKVGTRSDAPAGHDPRPWPAPEAPEAPEAPPGDVPSGWRAELVAAVESACGKRRAADGRRGTAAIVGVDGWSGSGKTSLASWLAPAVRAEVLALDDIVPGWHGLAASVDLLARTVLPALADGRTASVPTWDWVGERPGAPVVIAPAERVVVEGCGAGAAATRPWLDVLVWLEVDPAERYRRLQARPDWPLYRPWHAAWEAQEQRLRDRDDPRVAADVVVVVRGDEVAVVLRQSAG